MAHNHKVRRSKRRLANKLKIIIFNFSIFFYLFLSLLFTFLFGVAFFYFVKKRPTFLYE